MKVTLSPEHIFTEGEAEIDTDAATEDDTVIVIAFDEAGEPVTHASLLVITHVITSASASVDEV